MQATGDLFEYPGRELLLSSRLQSWSLQDLPELLLFFSYSRQSETDAALDCMILTETYYGNLLRHQLQNSVIHHLQVHSPSLQCRLKSFSIMYRLAQRAQYSFHLWKECAVLSTIPLMRACSNVAGDKIGGTSAALSTAREGVCLSMVGIEVDGGGRLSENPLL